ncbi:hypothetical protein JCM10213v2_007730 [Rhodosporidiobolus nylandii]
MAPLSIYEARAAGKQAEQCPRIRVGIEALAAAISLLDDADSSPNAGAIYATTSFFDALQERYGDTDQSREDAVDAGEAGIALVLLVLRRVVGFEEEEMAFRLWIARLTAAVTAKEQHWRNEAAARAAESAERATTAGAVLAAGPAPSTEDKGKQRARTPSPSLAPKDEPAAVSTSAAVTSSLKLKLKRKSAAGAEGTSKRPTPAGMSSGPEKLRTSIGGGGWGSLNFSDDLPPHKQSPHQAAPPPRPRPSTSKP